jgi:hypothetical protein
MSAPPSPDAASRERLLDMLAELVGSGGAGRFLAPPIEPGDRAFPDAWAPTTAGIKLVLRRLAMHADLAIDIEVHDQRAGAPPTEQIPSTNVEFVEMRGEHATFAMHFIGQDDVAGTLAHEIGVAYAVQHRLSRDTLYRAAAPPIGRVDGDADMERGSVAALYLGLGVLAVNSARQALRTLQGTSFNPMIVAPVGGTVSAGYISMESLAFLLAAQQVVRGVATPPPGLAAEQKREVAAWLTELRADGPRLRERLGIAADAQPNERAEIAAFADDETDAKDAPASGPTAFRWQTHRAGVGSLLGAGAGLVVGVISASTLVSLAAVLGGGVVGHAFGRRVPAPRCSACATRCAVGAPSCRSCGATLRGDIATLSDRLDAEERLDADNENAA